MLPVVQPSTLSEQVVVRMTPALRAQLKAAAAEAERTEAQEMRLALRLHLKTDTAA